MKKLFFSILLLMLSPVVWGATLNVNSSIGNDSNTYAQVAAGTHSWATIGRAAWGNASRSSPDTDEAAQAGDVVLIAAGTYTTDGEDGGGRFDVALNPANSGTSGNPITFRGVGTVAIRMNAEHSGPLIGSSSRNYIIWDNIYIDDAYSNSTADTGPVVISGSTGSQIINCTIVGTYQTWSDNYNGIRAESSSSLTVKNNSISGVTCNFSTNCAGIMLYDTRDSIFEHNYITNTATGIYIKGDHAADGLPQQDNIFRYNWIESVTAHGIGVAASTGSLIYQNIIKNAELAMKVYNFGSGQSTNITISNNTIISGNIVGDAGISYAGTDNLINARIFNNIFYGSFSEAVNIGEAALGDQSYEHNLYYGYDAWGSVDSAQRTFAVWKSTYEQDSASPAGVNQDPLFQNLTYYKLQAGSPAAALGVDILDLDGDSSTADNIPAGAYVTGNETIGIETTITTQTISSGVTLSGASLQ